MTTDDEEELYRPDFSGPPNYENPAFKAYAAGQFLIFSDSRLRTKEQKAKAARYLIVVPYVALVFVSVGIAYLAYRSVDNSLSQSFYIETSAGILTFLAFPLVFAAGTYKRKLTYQCTGLLTLVCIVLSTVTSSVTQSFFIEAAAGLVLLIALDLGFNFLLGRFEKIRLAAEEDVKAFLETIDEAEEALSPFRGAALGGGTMEETIQFNLVKKNIEICRTLLSDEPYLGNDLVQTITRVNQLKRNDIEEYKTIRAWLD